jgi:alanyl-tRNA synthetase
VDTGAGLERLSAVMQGITNNYDIDLFRGIVKAAADLAGTQDLSNPSLRVIADHIRACTFLIVDGVLPSNEGRGYVLRRIIRRAIRHGHKLGINGAFFHKLVSALEAQMGEAYPELRAGADHARRVLLQEEERFAETLTMGMSLLTAALDNLKGKVLDGETVFRLYDTYGFPADLTADVARERGIGIDNAGFEAAMEAQRERARAASRFGVDMRAGAQIDVATTFCGYEGTSGESTVIALLRDGQSVKELKPGERGEVILEQTPFYAESGGQVGDAGELRGADGVRFIVEDTQKRGTAGAHSHIGHVAADGATIREGMTLAATVDTRLRNATALNHSATHLLHAALREVLGTHVQQKGSLVAPDRLRFDFSHFQAITAEELQRIERRVNEQIRLNAAAETREMDYDSAVAAGAMALFGEKYTSKVRVLRIGVSMELCGGTHVTRAGDIGLFKILAESGVASGVRRIEAVTGERALAEVEASDSLVRELATLVRGSRDDVATKVRDALDRIRQLEKETRALRDKLASGQGTDLAAGAIDIGGLKVVATTVEGADAGALRTAVDQLKDRLKTAVIVLASVDASGKVVLVAGVTAGEVGRIKAGEVVGHVAAQIGGRGGGRPDFAQAGGTDAAKLPEALAGVAAFVHQKLR